MGVGGAPVAISLTEEIEGRCSSTCVLPAFAELSRSRCLFASSSASARFAISGASSDHTIGVPPLCFDDGVSVCVLAAAGVGGPTFSERACGPVIGACAFTRDAGNPPVE
jgi:hypothetical protein